MDTRQTSANDGTDERGVSPVIGVILMVAITVILAAVIATMVLDLAGVDAEAQAGVEISNDTVTVTSLSGADGVYVADESGVPLGDDAILTNTGASNSTDTSGTFAVVAFIGDEDEPENASTTTTIQTFEVD